MSKKIIRLPQVIEKVGLSRSSIYLLLKKNRFPASIQIGERSMGFLESDIDQWLDSKISNSKKGGSNV